MNRRKLERRTQAAERIALRWRARRRILYDFARFYDSPRRWSQLSVGRPLSVEDFDPRPDVETRGPLILSPDSIERLKDRLGRFKSVG